MQLVSVSFKVFWQFKDVTHYKVTKCKKIVNCQKGTLLNQSIRGGSVGYWIGKKFIKRNDLNNYIELIPINKQPF